MSRQKYFKNLKNGHIYVVFDENLINATNENDGQIMVLYKDRTKDQYYVREKNEFYKKFERME